MKVLIAGASGLVGQAVCARLASNGHTVLRLVRGRSASEDAERAWDPGAGEMDPEALDGVDGVICLSGENIANRRWTRGVKDAILRSRVDTVRVLSEAIAARNEPLPVFIHASALGYYGTRGGEILREDSPPGQGFLARVCGEWEKAASPAIDAGARVVSLRFGVVLDPAAGALKKMLTPFRLGLGGRLGPGTQYFSWLTLADAAAITVFALESPHLSGPVNAAAPEAVTNAEFTHVLGRVLKRPALIPMPAFAIGLVLGEMGRELLLSSTKAAPGALQAAGYRFTDPKLEAALRRILPP